ncbi:hypothetical protein BDV59DRAFT_75731 [Aspergillus ambiguus]|uniref:uncharacterized protein n=1 Tax=Aspergillus ambiguus TaxID=176160 RepID=UPI003CCE4B5C
MRREEEKEKRRGRRREEDEEEKRKEEDEVITQCGNQIYTVRPPPEPSRSAYDDRPESSLVSPSLARLLSVFFVRLIV